MVLSLPGSAAHAACPAPPASHSWQSAPAQPGRHAHVRVVALNCWCALQSVRGGSGCTGEQLNKQGRAARAHGVMPEPSKPQGNPQAWQRTRRRHAGGWALCRHQRWRRSGRVRRSGRCLRRSDCRRSGRCRGGGGGGQIPGAEARGCVTSGACDAKTRSASVVLFWPCFQRCPRSTHQSDHAALRCCCPSPAQPHSHSHAGAAGAAVPLAAPAPSPSQHLPCAPQAAGQPTAASRASVPCRTTCRGICTVLPGMLRLYGKLRLRPDSCSSARLPTTDADTCAHLADGHVFGSC